MGRRQISPLSSGRHQWERILKNLIEMLQSQQSQIETLADDRKFLEQYIHLQHDHWSSRARFLESHIAQLKKEEAKGRKIQAAKIDLMVDMKQREALAYKKQYELAESDLEDFCACVKTLSAELSELKENLKTGEVGKGRTGDCDSRCPESSKEAEHCTAALEGETSQIRKLKHYKKLSSKKEAEISALLAERDFVWNQLKKMESDYTAILKSKKTEVEHANEAIGKLQHTFQELQTSVNEKHEIISQLKARHELDMRRRTQEAEQANEKIEQLQLDKEELCSSAKEKDETIAKLRSELAKLETDAQNCTIGKSRFFKEHSGNASMIPSESNPRKGSRKRKTESAKQDTNQKCTHTNDDSSGSRVSAPVHGLVQCSSKRRTRSNSSGERPPLFDSNFKYTESIQLIGCKGSSRLHKRMNMRPILLKQSLYSPIKAHRTGCWIVFALVRTGVLHTGHTSLLIISAPCTLGVWDYKLRGKGTKASCYMYNPPLC